MSQAGPEARALPQNLVVAILLLLPFFLGGGIISYVLLLRPLFKIVDARNWVETPCCVLSSEVTNAASRGSYTAHILYSYQFDGEGYQSSRYNFVDVASEGRRSKEEMVARHPPRTEIVCWVNPRRPSEAVINRGLFGAMFGGVVALPIAPLAGWAIVIALCVWRDERNRR